MRYKIGDFAKILDTSVRTLRYYDEMNLLKPDYIDSFTGYRYYSEDQMDQLKEIKYLQQSGFTIQEIRQNKNKWNDNLLYQKRNSILEQAKELQDQIAKIDYLRSHNHEGILNIDKTKSLTKKKEMEYEKNIS